MTVRVRETLNHGHVREVRDHRLDALTDDEITRLFARLIYPVTFEQGNRYHRAALRDLQVEGVACVGWTDLQVYI